nr:uncharacterized protein LOC111420327 [Onthophagus taurus]
MVFEKIKSLTEYSVVGLAACQGDSDFRIETPSNHSDVNIIDGGNETVDDQTPSTTKPTTQTLSTPEESPTTSNDVENSLDLVSPDGIMADGILKSTYILRRLARVHTVQVKKSKNPLLRAKGTPNGI